MTFFATAARGTEPALRDELRELGFSGVRADRGGVHFEGDMAEGARACLWSRIAVRVLAPVLEFEARDGHELYDGIRSFSWEGYVSTRTTLAVRANCRSSALTHSQFIAQRTKDAIVDQLRDRFGARPSVDLDDPDVVVAVHLSKDVAHVYLDLAGIPLHRRGYRQRTVEAPLKETLAAAVVRFSGWNRKSPLLDPMCGSGTLAIEAAQWALRIAPGLSRERFGFERWALHDASAARVVDDLRQEAKSARLQEGPEIRASDVDASAVAATTANAAAAGVQIGIECASLGALPPIRGRRQIVVNPPYGERLDQTASNRDLHTAVHRLEPASWAVLASGPSIESAIGENPQRRIALFNGDLECRLLIYER